MNRDETIELWDKCQKAKRKALKAALNAGTEKAEAEIKAQAAAARVWNQWAQALLSEKKKLEKDEVWAISVHWLGGYSFSEPTNEKTREWLENSTAEFSGYIFRKEATFNSFIFPGDALFQCQDINENGKSTENPAIFDDYTSFCNVHFGGNTYFLKTKFKSYIYFDGAVFDGVAGFDNAVFKASTSFKNVTFKEAASFEVSKFRSPVDFRSSSFKAMANFKLTNFHYGADFTKCYFAKQAIFKNTSFDRFDMAKASTNFSYIRSDGAFELYGAYFSRVPNFRQADFRNAPDMDQMKIGKEPVRSMEAVARYRALKRMAIQGNDHDQEINFFVGELEAKGFSFLSWGNAYKQIANYGRSTLRPFGLWMFCTILFAGMYYALHLNNFAATQKLNGCSSISSAIKLSLRKASIALGWEKSSTLDQIYSCLYGFTGSAPIMPIWVLIASLAQSFLSAIFIFLMLLALRNKFRIK